MGRPELGELLAGAEYSALKVRLSGMTPKEIKPRWVGLAPLQKLAMFKLLPPAEAIAFFAALDPEDKYLVFCGFDLGSIAPLTEALPPGRAMLFERLGQDVYREMLRQLTII